MQAKPRFNQTKFKLEEYSMVSSVILEASTMGLFNINPIR